MSNQSSNAPPSNSLRGLAGSNSHVVNAESFTEGQRRAVDRYVELSKSAGVLVGAQLGAAAWDLRPLVLEEGKIAILRFSDPSLVLQKSRYSWLKEQLQRRTSWGPRPHGLGFGEEGGQLWLKRAYFQKVLADPGAAGSEGSERYALLQAVVAQLRSMHQSGLVHGHVAPGNLVFEDRNFALFDAAFRAVITNPDASQFRAPELNGEAAPTAAADVYGLGVLISRLLKGECPVALRALAERAVDRDPLKRPQITEIEDQLTRLAAGAIVKNASQAASAAAAAAAAARGGKRISATVTAPTDPKPPPAAHKGYSPPERIARELKQTVLLPRDLVDEARKDVLGPGSGSSPPPAAEPPRQELPPAAVSEPATEGSRDQAVERTEAPAEPRRREVPERAFASEIVTPRPSKPPIILIAAIIVILVVVVVRVTGFHQMFGRKNYDMPFEEYWKSGQRSLMAQVAEAAIEGGVPAAKVAIIGDALKGGVSPLARESMLRFVFDERWEQRLGEADRDAALKLALAPLYPEGLATMPPFEKLHPVVILGAMSDLPLDKELGVLSKLPLKLLIGAPAPLGDLFEALSSAGAQTLGDPAVRAVSHVVAGDTSPAALEQFFAGGEPRERLRLLLPLTGQNQKLDAGLLGFLEGGQTLLADYAIWFHGDDVAQWDQVPAALKVRVVIGDVPASGLTLEQYADLLQFPDESVRKSAVIVLAKNFLGRDSAPTLQFLAGSGNLLGRFQCVALVAAFKLDPDPYYAFLTKWFEAKPDPSSILGLLLARGNVTGVDALNFQSASYLKKASWNAALTELTMLSKHPEGLARALAYSKLDPSKPNERAVMQEALKREPNRSFRDELARRLAEDL